MIRSIGTTVYWWEKDPWVNWTAGAVDSRVNIFDILTPYQGEATLTECEISGEPGHTYNLWLAFMEQPWPEDVGPVAIFVREDVGGRYRVATIIHGSPLGPLAIILLGALAALFVLAVFFPSTFKVIAKRIQIFLTTTTEIAGETSLTIVKATLEPVEEFATRATDLTVSTLSKLSTGIGKAILPFLLIGVGLVILLVWGAPRVTPTIKALKGV